jgi:HPt (histidine-containing phosphotransfer) domain-containing protein
VILVAHLGITRIFKCCIRAPPGGKGTTTPDARQPLSAAGDAPSFVSPVHTTARSETPAIGTLAPAQPSVDLTRFREDLRAADIENMVETLLATFLEDAPHRLATLEQAVKSRDAKAVQTAAHAFKSGAGTIRATRLAALLAGAEAAALSGTMSGTEVMLDEVRSEHIRVRLEIEKAVAHGA